MDYRLETKQLGRDDWMWPNNALACFYPDIMRWQAARNRPDWDQSSVKMNSINKSNRRRSGYMEHFPCHQGKGVIDKKAAGRDTQASKPQQLPTVVGSLRRGTYSLATGNIPDAVNIFNDTDLMQWSCKRKQKWQYRTLSVHQWCWFEPFWLFEWTENVTSSQGHIRKNKACQS